MNNKMETFVTKDTEAEVKSLVTAAGITFEKVVPKPILANSETPKTPSQMIDAQDRANRDSKGRYIHEPNCLVYDWTLGYDLEYIENPPGYTKEFNGRWIYPVRRVWNKSKDGRWDYTVTAFPEPAEMEVSPQSLFRLTHWDNLVKDGFGKDSEIWDKLATGAMIALVGICLFAIFLLTQSTPA